MTLELFLATALAAPPAGKPVALQEKPVVAQDNTATGEPGTPDATPDAPEDSGPLAWALASTEELSWEEADAACRDLVADGLADWRLPTIDELAIQRSTIPASLEALLEGRQIDAWACNPLEETRPETIGEGVAGR